jgi:hypothetical protein
MRRSWWYKALLLVDLCKVLAQKKKLRQWNCKPSLASVTGSGLMLYNKKALAKALEM